MLVKMGTADQGLEASGLLSGRPWLATAWLERRAAEVLEDGCRLSDAAGTSDLYGEAGCRLSDAAGASDTYGVIKHAELDRSRLRNQLGRLERMSSNSRQLFTLSDHVLLGKLGESSLLFLYVGVCARLLRRNRQRRKSKE